jgi:hypothetical protein
VSETQGSAETKPYALDSDEYYPWMFLARPRMNEVHENVISRGQDLVDLTDEEYADYLAAMNAFECWQERLRDASPRRS